MHWLLVFVGGGMGAAARHAINRAGLAVLGPGFPWWTLAVNVSGSFAIGLLAGLFGAMETGQNARLFLITGFLGGFTTFSAFSLESVALFEGGQVGRASAYVLASVALSVTAAFLGLVAARQVLAR